MSRSKLAALLASLALTFSGATMVLASGTSLDICHGNNSETNPYIAESPDIDSTGLKGGHIDHVGPIWYPGAKADKVVWGDIIPPFDYDSGNGIVHYPGLNWTESGQAILANGCVAEPGIHVVKTPSVDALPAVGGEVTYTYKVTNIGQLVLSNVTVSDNKCSPVTYVSGDANSNDKLDLSETWTFTCTATLTATTTNTGRATGHAGNVTVTDTDQATVTVPQENPAVAIDKTADPETLPAGGGDVTYTYVVTNTGNVPIFDVNVRDDNGTADTGDDFDVTCPAGTLAVGAHMTCTADVTGITMDTTNIATVTANYDDCNDGCSSPVPPATDDATVTVEPAAPNTPGIHVVKSASVTDLPSVGGDVTYTYVVTNTGDVALTGVTVTDDKCAPVGFVSGDTNTDGILDVTETWTYSCTATLTATTTNTALATGHDGETAVTDTDEATVTVAPAPGTPGINVAKTPSVTDLPSVGGDVTYTYVVTNTGSVPLTAVTVTDDKCDPVGFVSGDTNSDSILDLTETWTYSCTTNLTATTTNTALATGHDGETAVTDTDQATVTVAPPGGGVGGETSPPKVTQPPTDTVANTTGGGMGDSLPYLLIVLGIIGFGAVLLTPTRPRR